VVENSLFDNFDLEPPKSRGAYFSLASGLIFMIVNILNYLSRRQKTRGDSVRITVNFVAGAGLYSLTAQEKTDR